ncbi:MAG TPA: MFS transporter, partial [Actinomycetota bacterium]
MALYGIAFLGVAPIGCPVAGWLAERFGTRMSIGFGGIVAVVTGLVGLWMLARLRRQAPSAATQEERGKVVEVPVRVVGSNGTERLRA